MRGQLETHCLECILKMSNSARSAQNRGDGGMTQNPRDRQLHGRNCAHPFKRLQFGQRMKTPFVEIDVGMTGDNVKSRAGRHLCAISGIFSGEKTGRQRAVRQKSQSLLSTERQQILFGVARSQIVNRFDSIQPGSTPLA